MRWSTKFTGDGLAGTCVEPIGADAGIPDADPGDGDTAIDASSVDADVAPPDAAPVPDASPPDAPDKTWSSPSVVLGVAPEGHERHPSISTDGLSLYFTRFVSFAADVFVVTRASTALPFGTPVAVAPLNSSADDADPEVSANHLEMYFTATAPGPGTTTFIARSTRISPAVAWGAPVFLGGDLKGFSPSLSGNGLSMYFVGKKDTDCSGTAPCLKKTTRSSLVGGWSSPTEITFTPPAAYWHVDISSDELSILVSSRDIGANGQPLILISERTTTSAGFTSFQQIPQLEIASFLWDAEWNADETEIYFTAGAFETYNIYVSVLQ